MRSLEAYLQVTFMDKDIFPLLKVSSKVGVSTYMTQWVLNVEKKEVIDIISQIS